MNAPQIIYIVLMALSLGTIVAKHGEARRPYNFGVSLAAASIHLTLVWWGGFFS